MLSSNANLTVEELAAQLSQLIEAGEGKRIVIVGIGDYVRSSAREVQLDGTCQVLIR